MLSVATFWQRWSRALLSSFDNLSSQTLLSISLRRQFNLRTFMLNNKGIKVLLKDNARIK